MERDFDADMRAVFRAAVPIGITYSAPILAEKIVVRLRKEDPELLAGWLDRHAAPILAERLGRLQRAERGVRLHRAPTKAFEDAVRLYQETGDELVLKEYSALLTPYPLVGKNLGDMTREDCLKVAADYRHRAGVNAFEASFLERIALRISEPTGVVRDYFTDDELLGLRGERTA